MFEHNVTGKLFHFAVKRKNDKYFKRWKRKYFILRNSHAKYSCISNRISSLVWTCKRSVLLLPRFWHILEDKQVLLVWKNTCFKLCLCEKCVVYLWTISEVTFHSCLHDRVTNCKIFSRKHFFSNFVPFIVADLYKCQQTQRLSTMLHTC